jgi:ArsR family transcriptional regulator, arsenate/arsenite/antimonite-responsive transcriptional repressor / arsenate reductase (thioredoxin)
MTKADLIAALAALGQETRLDILRMLAQRGAEGLSPGVIGERLKLPLPTLSFHLNDLKHSGLVVSRRESKAVLYEAKVSTVHKVVEYLTENCCGRVKAENLVQLPRAKTSGGQMKILFLCTRNSARSIMAECAMNRLGEGRFQAFSAGSAPAVTVHPATLRVLRELSYETGGLRSKSWDEFAAPQNAPLDFVFTLCDRAAAEPCPAWPGQPLRAHWGIKDPLVFEGSSSSTRKIFLETYAALEQRIKIFTSLPVETLERFALERWVTEIGKLDLAA